MAIARSRHHVGVDRDGLADFLRTRRGRLAPTDVGLAPGVRRRTPGLRREEVALLASMSTDYYTRLEQARGPRPSVAILGGLARALRLTDDERDHLLHLAGYAAPARSGTGAHVSPGLSFVLDRLDDTPATIVSDLGDVVVQNAMARALFGHCSNAEQRRSNLVWRWFTDPASRQRFPPEDWAEQAESYVADLRATYGRRRGDEDVEALVGDLIAASTEFADLWARHDVAVRRSNLKRVIHPLVGLLELRCEVLTSLAGGLSLVVLHPEPGTSAGELLELLAVVGTQDLTAPEVPAVGHE